MMLTSGSAWAGHIFINNIPADAIQLSAAADIPDAKVHIEANGDIYITAPGWDIKPVTTYTIGPTGNATTSDPPAPANTDPPANDPPANDPPANDPPASQPTVPLKHPGTKGVKSQSGQKTVKGQKNPTANDSGDPPGHKTTIVGSGNEPDNPASDPVPTSLSKHYWLAVVQSGTMGATQYDVDVYLNGNWVNRVRSSDGTVVPVDVTKYVHPGANSVHFSALKNLGGTTRVSQSPTDQIEVVVGEGDIAAGKLTIDQVDADFVRNASETDPIAQDFNFSGR
jgi:hypothetical protein